MFDLVPLEGLILIKHGFAFKGEHFVDSGEYLLLTPGNVHPEGGLKLSEPNEKYYSGKFPKSYVFDKGDLVIVMTDLTQEAAILGGAFIIPGSNKFLHNQRLGKVQILNPTQLDPLFLYHNLNWQFFRGQVRASASGTTVRHTAPERIYKCKIPLPNLATQQRIAGILSAYDELIEVNNQRIRLLEDTARQLYKEWFVRLRFPGYEQTHFVKGLPEGWCEISFRDFIKLNRGFDLPDEQIIDGIYPVVASTSIKAYHNEYKVEAPCIATGRSGSLGTVQYINQRSWPLNTSLYVKDFKGNSPRYVYYFLQSLNLENFNAGAGVPSLNQNHLHGLKFAVPPKKLQKQFDDLVVPMFTQIETLQSQNTHLRQIRDRLLPRLISGKLSVGEVERVVASEPNLA